MSESENQHEFNDNSTKSNTETVTEFADQVTEKGMFKKIARYLNQLNLEILIDNHTVSFKNEGSMLTETDSNKMIELANSIGQMPTLESEAISDDKLGVIVQIIEDNSEMDSGFQSR